MTEVLLAWALIATINWYRAETRIVKYKNQLKLKSKPKHPSLVGHIAHEGVRGFWCNGVGSKYPCKDCLPE
jgi:hypothetical protein